MVATSGELENGDSDSQSQVSEHDSNGECETYEVAVIDLTRSDASMYVAVMRHL